MAARGSGKIVWNSSDAGLQTPPFGGAYTATKWAIEAIAATMRDELAPAGIQVATIEPGFYLTGFNDTALEGSSYWYDPATVTVQRASAGRSGTPERMSAADLSSG
jgi:NAD(P)-dependent dehydrogenase (short-subunit alcohol dehydrogenase family)